MSLLSAELPNLDMKKQEDERLSQQKIWEKRFEENHEAFAESVVLGIAGQIIKEFSSALQDPYNMPISSKNKITKNISFDITKSSAAKKLIELAKLEASLPPFKLWLNKFSGENKEEEPQFSSFEIGGSRGHKYFEDLMAIVGRLAETKLQSVFKNLQSQLENKDLDFTVQWYRKDDQQFSNPSNFRDNCLRIEIWSKRVTDLEVTPNAENGSNVISLNRIKQKELQSTRTRNNILLAITVLIIGVFILKSGVLEILSKPRTT